MKALVLIAILASWLAAYGQESPNIYLESKSVGNSWAAFRDQSHEMAKDFAKACPEVQVTTNREAADYLVSLNHIEAGWWRNNQIGVADTFGNVVSAKEGSNINSGVKRACALILTDWSNPTHARQRLVRGINADFQRGSVVGYAELSGDKLTIHSERASAMRLRMIMASRPLTMIRRAGITTCVYTDDADQNFVYDVKLGQIVASPIQQAAQGNNEVEH